MPTKLSRFCEGVIEASWLAAVILIPVFFNVYSSRIFEPDKITILRSLALLAAGAWVVKLVEEGGPSWRKAKGRESFLRWLARQPLMLPVMSLVVVYLVSTVFSVTPRISLWGSYQRLQGTYTTLSYLVIFAAMAANLRKRTQVERLITTVILASLPVALYGVLQRYQIDPIPWAGDTTRRIAANMGNSIFVAAYLIMVFPLTMGRVISSFKSILKEEQNLLTQVVRGTVYVFILALQLIAVYMSGSRGPVLGLFAGIYFMALLLSLYWRKRWLTIAIVVASLVGGAFLLVFNIDNGPLESLRESPAIGRFGLLLDPDSNSALVRKYIWQGTVKLVGPHAPLKFPDGDGDRFNFLRPLVGYGPEGMYVAYNQFYTSDLGHVEKRNASPDRSHNETWDSLVITGGLGLVVYLMVFGSVFYYGLKWLGLIHTKRQKYVFLGLLLGGGIVGGVGMSIWRGVEFLGVGLPFGMGIGMVAYITIAALFTSSLGEITEKGGPGILALIVLLAAAAGHFIEINFGIAIVSTRLLFWVYAGLIFLLGYVFPATENAESEPAKADAEGAEPGKTGARRENKTLSGKRLKSGRRGVSALSNKPAWVRESLINVALVAFVLVTLGYDYIGNSEKGTPLFSIIGNSLTRLPNKADAFSIGVLALILTTWLGCILVFSSENRGVKTQTDWLKAFGLTSAVSGGVILLFWLWHAGSLAALANFTPANQNDVITQVGNIGGLLTKFYFFVFLIICAAAYLLPENWPSRGASTTPAGAIAAPVMVVLVMIIAYTTNLRVIQADITFKMAEPFTKGGNWQMATFLYKRALELAPAEDHYYLFLGRSYLEQAKASDSATDQDNLILQAEDDLKVAQRINPLNTDHTANLGRLYSWWAGKAADGVIRAERGQRASDYYGVAVTLSPNNATLWGEWAILYLQVIRQPQEAFARLSHAIEVDPEFSFTQGLMGDYYLALGRSTTDIQAKTDALSKAASHYAEAARVWYYRDTTPKSTYLVSEANALIELAGADPSTVNQEALRQAIELLTQSIDAGLGTADVWKVQEAVAKLYLQLGEKANALAYANLALAGAPEDSVARVQALITQIQAAP